MVPFKTEGQDMFDELLADGHLSAVCWVIKVGSLLQDRETVRKCSDRWSQGK